MYYPSIKSIISILVLVSLVGFAVTPTQAVTMFDNSNGPELPAACGSIQVPEGNKLAFHDCLVAAEEN